jgi:molecular chaperone GrpE
MSFHTGNPYGRRAATQRVQSVPMDKYQQVLRAYQDLNEQSATLQAKLEQQSRELAEAEKQLAIKNEALQKYSEELNKLDAELVFAKAALQQQDKSAEQVEEDEVNWADKYARLQAEMENLRKRWEQRYASESMEARHRILLDMLPLADHLEMALNHAQTTSAESNTSFVENIRATQRAFQDTLKRYNVVPVDAKGKEFDPTLHEAMGQITSDDVPSGDVAEVLQTGYIEGDRLLRPARVMVSSGAAAVLDNSAASA